MQTKWTKNQMQAIKKEGSNLLVAAAARKPVKQLCLLKEL